MFYEVVQEDRFCPFMEDEEDVLLDGLERLADYFGPFQDPQSQRAQVQTQRGILQAGGSPNQSSSTTTIIRMSGQTMRDRGSRNHNQRNSQRKKSLKRKQCCLCNCHEDSNKSFTTTKSSCPGTSEDVKLKKADILVPSEGPSDNANKFQVRLDVDSRYEPGELKVKLSRDNRSLIVEGCHQESHNNEFGFSQVSTQMYQRFSVPQDVNVEALQCDLDARGQMVISAPMKLPALEEAKTMNNSNNETIIPVIRASDDSDKT